MVPENPYTHVHGMVGCFLAEGVDPTVPPIALTPGALEAVAEARASGVGLPMTVPTAPGSDAIPGLVVYLTLAVAYFALGVAVGALTRRLRRLQTAVLLVLVVPGVLAGLGLLAWIVYSFRA